jgi:hypothetical protein
MIREISRSPDKAFRISDSIRPETPMEQVRARQESPAVRMPVFQHLRDSGTDIGAHQFFARLEQHFITKYGNRVATVKAHILFDVFGPGRNIDPLTLFPDDSEGDSWAEAVSSQIF